MAVTERVMDAPDGDRTPLPVGDARHVVIVGAGFAGLNCARALGGSDVRVTVIDRRNYTLFTPLLYQVATAALSPAEITATIRRILARYPNIDVIMADVVGIDHARRRVLLQDGGFVPYDDLVLATGSVENYFGHADWAREAPGLKSVSEARAIRAALLSAFERAETSGDPEQRRALLTIIIIGGGPTGVEMSGAVAELARFSLARDFRRIDPTSAKIVLVEAGSRLLAGFPEKQQSYAASVLARLGVQIRLGTAVTGVAEGAIVLSGGEKIEAATIIWGAGVRASETAEWLGVVPDRSGRMPVEANFAIGGVSNIYAIGDVVRFEQDGQPLPALAQVAKQQGQHLGRALRENRLPPPFRYRSRGDVAVIGRRAAVFTVGRWRLEGRLAWLLWAIVHIYLLIGADKRMLVAIQWLWRYFTYERGARLID